MQLVSQSSREFQDPIGQEPAMFSFSPQLNKKWLYKSMFFNFSLSAGWIAKRWFFYPHADVNADFQTKIEDNYGYYFRKNVYDNRRHYYLTTGVSVGYTFGQVTVKRKVNPVFRGDC